MTRPRICQAVLQGVAADTSLSEGAPVLRDQRQVRYQCVRTFGHEGDHRADVHGKTVWFPA